MFVSLVPLTVHHALEAYETRRKELVDRQLERLKEQNTLISGWVAETLQLAQLLSLHVCHVYCTFKKVKMSILKELHKNSLSPTDYFKKNILVSCTCKSLRWGPSLKGDYNAQLKSHPSSARTCACSVLWGGWRKISG